MNCEEQAVDLCSAIDLCNVPDNTISQPVDEILPRDGLLLMDGDLGERDATVLTRLKDVHPKDDGSSELKAPHSKNNGSVAVSADPVNGSAGDLQQNTSKFEAPPVGDDGDDDGGEMDIGVDLSLDENGVLEFEPTAQTQNEESASHCENSLTSEADIELHSQQPPEERREDVSSETTSAATTPGNGAGIKHGSKRVTFPSDEDIVSGAVEPKDPWRHAQNVTVEEILNAYRQACQKLNCKPIPKVLKQIQDLKDLTQRNECLELKGEKLDYKSCESLEEIFKRVQFKVLDLEQTNLDEDGASALFDMIEYYESATHLNISSNKHIGTRGWQAAAHMMRKTSSLQYLDARNSPLLDHSAPFVARALRISGSLTVLHLENAGISGRPLMLLATALKMNMNLRELYLAENKLSGLQDSAQLGNLLKFNYNIQILDLRNNHILDSGLAYICEGLKEQRKGLVTLVLWNNQLTHNGMGYLAAALPFTQSLETLNLGHNAVGNEGVHKLKDGLIANRSILRLGLASTKLSCEGAVAIAEFIAESPRILRLDMRENEIKTGGLMALSLAFKVNSSLLRLDLDREPKKETVKCFIETQRSLLSDIQNGCKRNFILAKEKEETEQKMRQSISIAEIATEDQTQEDEDASAEKSEEENTTDEGSASESQEVDDQNPTLQDDSDSDTEDEDAAEEPKTPANTTSPIAIPAINACKAVPSMPPLPGSPGGITVTEASAVPRAPPSPGRCFSVSSPGRGRKIFMVTRVESPPEQQQTTVLAKGVSEWAAQSQACTQTNLKAPFDARSQPPEQPTASELSTLTSRAETTPAPVEPLNTSMSSLADKQENLKESQSEIAQDPATPFESLKDAVFVDQTHLKQQLTVNTNTQKTQEMQNVSEKDQTFCPHTKQKQDSSPIQTESSVSGQSQDETLSPKAEPCPEQLQEVGNGEKQVQSSEQQRAAQLQPSLEVTAGHKALDEEEGCSARAGSPDVSSTEEDKGHPAGSTGASLPNGLKPEFAFHLLEPKGPKPASCIMEHVSVTAELSCGQDLEELLLDASLDTSRDAP
ncbi:protein phosphatase 1 regulatory subunit 37-like [Sinocyclocheilus anshuiensis]|uniref:Protein phosphatase 1 regulatory subunit 37 n=1 Tax=Sinocyclocheilus anshuiensis TaxID=1608454 RepID=A0A671K1B5_9TELE|nr:PREDICTED: protein phosphatase 1 regulatory subunit 37-like [Sinocyclocheilus anshuiensis]